MSTLKSIIFETLPDPEEYWETAEALKDLDRQYQHFTRTVWKASKQLLKFDEINHLVACEVEEKAPKTTTTRASTGRSETRKSVSTSTAASFPMPRRGIRDVIPARTGNKNSTESLSSWVSVESDKIFYLYTSPRLPISRTRTIKTLFSTE